MRLRANRVDRLVGAASLTTESILPPHKTVTPSRLFAHLDAASDQPRIKRSAVLIHLQNVVADSLSQLDSGWYVLVDLRISGSSGVIAADYMVMHAQIGVALIDLMVARTDDLPQRLSKLMDDEGFSARFPGVLPIVRLVLQSTRTWLGDELEAAFAHAAPLTLADPRWVYALRDLLVPTEGASDSSVSPFCERSAAGAPPPSVSELRWEEKGNWLDKLWHVIPERRLPGAKPRKDQSLSMSLVRNARPAGISDERAGAIEDQERWPSDQRGEPAVWETAPEIAGEEVASSLAASAARSWSICAAILLVVILSSVAGWLFFGPTSSEATRRRIEMIATPAAPPIAALVSVPDPAPEVNPAQPHDRVVDLGAQPPPPAVAATPSSTLPVAKPQVKPEPAPLSEAAPKSQSFTREAVQRPAVSVRRGDEIGRRRLIFEWPSEVEFTAKVARGEAKILFKSVAQIDLHQLSTAASGLNPRLSRSNRNVLLLLKLPPGSRLMAHHRGNRVVLDIASTTAVHP